MEPQKQPQAPAPSQPTPVAPNTAAPAPTGAPAPQKSKGYGKRPMWQWVVIYLVAAIIVYGLIYVLFIHKSGSTGY